MDDRKGPYEHARCQVGQSGRFLVPEPLRVLWPARTGEYALNDGQPGAPVFGRARVADGGATSQPRRAVRKRTLARIMVASFDGEARLSEAAIVNGICRDCEKRCVQKRGELIGCSCVHDTRKRLLNESWARNFRVFLRADEDNLRNGMNERKRKGRPMEQSVKQTGLEAFAALSSP